ncbi:phosphopantetheine-binding protein [Hominenteromicrobium sp.]|uniref:phosphopantetheine-binding protein n=1 Tax=Hominenteromicrobium sp. TaxID=3073581 RepID=UPI00399C07B8
MFSRQEIRDKIYELLDEVGAVEIDGDGNKVLISDMDSIQLISLVVEIEECFGIEIPDEYLVTEFFESVEHVIDTVQQLMNEQK